MGSPSVSRNVRVVRSGSAVSAPLVGRGRELATLVGLACASPSLAVVEGQAGVGKSRLVADLMTRPELGDRRRLVGRCALLRRPLPLAPFVEALRGVSDVGDGAPLGGPGAGLARLVSLLAAAARESPVRPVRRSLAERHLAAHRFVP